MMAFSSWWKKYWASISFRSSYSRITVYQRRWVFRFIVVLDLVMYAIYFAFNHNEVDWILRSTTWVLLLITAIMVWIPKFVAYLELLFFIPCAVIMLQVTVIFPYGKSPFWVTVLGRDMALLLMYPIMAQIQPRFAIFWPPIALLSYLLVGVFPWMRVDDFTVGLSSHTMMFLFFIVVASIYCVSLDWMSRKQYRHNQILGQRIQRSQQKKDSNQRLVEHIFPGQVHSFVMASGENPSEARGKRFVNAVVIFGELVQFSRYSETIPTFQAVDTLNKVYALWDSLADQHGLVKIKTISETYMAVGNCPDAVPKMDCPERAVQFCLDAIRGFKALQPTLFPNESADACLVSPRFGVHIGPLVAGTIGAIKLTFDIWGDTVNIASRLCTNGKPMHVQVSASILQHLLLGRNAPFPADLPASASFDEELTDDACRQLAQQVEFTCFLRDSDTPKHAHAHAHAPSMHVTVEPRGALQLKNRGAFNAFLVSLRAGHNGEDAEFDLEADADAHAYESENLPFGLPLSATARQALDMGSGRSTPVLPFGSTRTDADPNSDSDSAHDSSACAQDPDSSLTLSLRFQASARPTVMEDDAEDEGGGGEEEGDAILEMIRSACNSCLQRVPEEPDVDSARSVRTPVSSAAWGESSAHSGGRGHARHDSSDSAGDVDARPVTPSTSADARRPGKCLERQKASLPELSPASPSSKAASSALRRLYLFKDRTLLPKYCASALPHALRFHQISCVLLVVFFGAMLVMDAFRFAYCLADMMLLHGAGLAYGVFVSLSSFLGLPRLTRRKNSFVAQNALPFVAIVSSLVINGAQWGGMAIAFTSARRPHPVTLAYLHIEGYFYFGHILARMWFACLLFPVHSVAFKLVHHFVSLLGFNLLAVLLFPEVIDPTPYAFNQGVSTLGCIIVVFATERTWRKDYLNIHEIAKRREVLVQENHKSKQLLRSLVPPRLLRRLLTNPSAIAERISDCTMLYADLVSFTTWCHSQSADEIVTVLDRLFKRIDFVAARLGVDQCCTIGDCYVATANVMRPVRNHHARMVRFAREMLRELHQFNEETGRRLQLRIGIGAGSVISAVLGTQRFTYDCFGPAANSAKLMETTGLANMIHLSQQVRLRIPSDEFPVREGPEVAGDATYFLLETNPED